MMLDPGSWPASQPGEMDVGLRGLEFRWCADLFAAKRRVNYTKQ